MNFKLDTDMDTLMFGSKSLSSRPIPSVTK